MTLMPCWSRKWTQNGSEMVLWGAFWESFGPKMVFLVFVGGEARRSRKKGARDAFEVTILVRKWTKMDQKMVQKRKKIESEINFEFDIVVLAILDAIWKDF